MGETMTNNPTIDGVSRGLIEMTIDLLQDLRRGTAVERKLRALLDAPAVERQDEVAFLEMELEGERRAKLELADVLGVGDEPRWKWMLSAARAQQSTISRLEAQLNNAIDLDFQRRERITQLESEKEFAAATYQAARDRIAELESGRGEAPFYISVDDWNMLVRDDVEIASVRVSRTRRSKFTESLFAHPPEVAALQSTIAQLQAENSRIKSRLCVCRDCGGQGEVYSGHSSYQGHNQPPEPDMDVCGTCGGDGVLGPLEDFEALAVERDKLQARVAELEKYAARYQWLRDKSESCNQFYLSTPLYFTGVKFTKENVDSTIDACLDATAALNGVKP